jgi:hypothetical protein
MFKVNFNSDQFAKIEAKFRDDIQAILSNTDIMKDVGEFMVDRVKYQARIAKPFNADGSFPDLKDSTVANRRYLAKFNEVDATFSPTRSNLTITGQFLNSLTYLVQGPGLVQILYDGIHTGYMSGKGRVGKSVANSDLVKWLSDKGFNVMDRSLADNQTVKRRVAAIALGYIRRGLKVQNRL